LKQELKINHFKIKLVKLKVDIVKSHKD